MRVNLISQVPSLLGSKARISSFKSQVPTVQVHWVLPFLCYLDLRERSLRFLVPSSKFRERKSKGKFGKSWIPVLFSFIFSSGDQHKAENDPPIFPNH